MKLSGSYKLQVKKEIVWRALNDPSILVLVMRVSIFSPNLKTFRTISKLSDSLALEDWFSIKPLIGMTIGS